MEVRRPYKRPKRTAIELTSLLDLLFVMIFVSLIQQKEVKKAEPTPVKEVKVEKPVPQKPVQVNFSITATFNFYKTSQNPNLPSGSYVMQGSYNSKSGELKLGGVGWVNRPANYDMVPLSGKIDASQNIFTGSIESIGCKTFTLKRESKESTTPISGEWKGTYDCSQGMTGLTLTIQ